MIFDRAEMVSRCDLFCLLHALRRAVLGAGPPLRSGRLRFARVRSRSLVRPKSVLLIKSALIRPANGRVAGVITRPQAPLPRT